MINQWRIVAIARADVFDHLVRDVACSVRIGSRNHFYLSCHELFALTMLLVLFVRVCRFFEHLQR